ncbi:unnamed protein product [Penicillium nalgiovense]|uniref:Uncharacterized protein n=1 Tax=Penicillium nalgiovense TaxID=60175 RepID=A0A9W4MWC7_PENNA|nr:unnamed protein product [Penicillium nalgiovense]CAG8127629.1 unnamed protein product [Penicillium nalgiovense]CAG8130726.1 unnamed protein product [Penicillium nalgiovense]CAG8132571.1 unnamed protein product [Penicillium nalgiovense]CAG8132673.1 unnamed protein product [Penicillium nalgiovense]
MVVPFVTCCGWFSNVDSSSGAWDTRHCLLAGRSMGEGEVGWSILAAVTSTSASSPRIERTLERPVNS